MKLLQKNDLTEKSGTLDISRARGSYQNISEEEKVKQSQYHRERNKDLSEEQKQKQYEYMRNYYLAHKK